MIKNKISSKLVFSVIALILITLTAIGIPSYYVIVGESNKVLDTQMMERVMCAWDVADGQNVHAENGKITIQEAKNEFQKYILSRQVGKNGYGYTVDGSNGTYIFHPDTNKVGQTEANSSHLTEMLQHKSEFSNQQYGNVNVLKVNYTLNGVKKFAYYTYYAKWNMFIALSGNSSDFLSAQKKALSVLLGVGLVILVLSSLIVYMAAKRIMKPITQIAKAMNEVENGHLNIDKISIKSNDEIGTLGRGFNSMLDNLKNLTENIKVTGLSLNSSVIGINKNIEETLDASKQVSKSSQEIAVANTSLAQEVDEGSNFIRRVSNYALNTTESAKKMQDIAAETNKYVVKGSDITKQLADKSLETQKNFDIVAEKVKNLQEQSYHISEVTEVIRSIAEQTNLLSLNAAIEAARAGESGRGFSVVAEEIRKLAEQSAKETDSITSVVKNIQLEIDNIVKNVSESDVLINNQSVIVHDTENIFNEIENKMTDMVKNIDTVSQKVMDINKNVGLSADTMQNISAATEETSASSQEVSALSEHQLENIKNISQLMDEIQNLSSDLSSLIINFKTE